jgi:hypothetical protein
LQSTSQQEIHSNLPKKKIGLLLPESNSLDVDLCKYKLLKTIYSSFVNTVVSWTKKNFKSCFGLFVLWTIKKKTNNKKETSKRKYKRVIYWKHIKTTSIKTN